MDMPKIFFSIVVLLIFNIQLNHGYKIIFPHGKGEENPDSDFFEGDIVLGVNRHNGITNKQNLWLKNSQNIVLVPYQIQPSGYSEYDSNRGCLVFIFDIFFISANVSDSNHNALILSSLKDIEKSSCIRFTPRTNQRDYIEVVNGNGCSSYVGKVSGKQIVTLSASGCMRRGIVTHEILHVRNHTFILIFIRTSPCHSNYESNRRSGFGTCNLHPIGIIMLESTTEI